MHITTGGNRGMASTESGIKVREVSRQLDLLRTLFVNGPVPGMQRDWKAAEYENQRPVTVPGFALELLFVC